MKIVCESCGAKYSIADERVTGKVFKIRCKRCSEVIIVRGDQQAQPAAEPQSVSADQGAIWHVVVEGEQAGPYTPSQLAEMLSASTVDWEAYVWTEGFDNWLPMRDVPDLVAQITGQSAAAAQPPATQSRAAAYRSSVNQTLTGQPSMGADPFADDAPADAGLFSGGAAATATGPDLFARAPAHAGTSPFAAGQDSGMLTSAVTPRVEAAQAMTGARNENSVLFSLKNLQALATGSGTSLPPATTGGGGGGGGERAGYAGGEGSGLIDIRALATATGVNESSDGSGARDELLSIGSQGGAFGTLGSPMLAPTRDEGDGNKKVLIGAVVAMVGFMSVAAVAIFYILRTSAAPANQPVAVAPTAAVGAVAAAQPPGTAAPTPEPPPSEGVLATRTAQEEKNTESATRSASERSTRRRGGASDTSDRTAESPAPGASAPEKKEAPSRPSGPKSIDELLDGALSGPAAGKTKPAESAPSNLADTPSRDQVISAMGSVKGAVSSCAQGQGGVAMVTVSVAGETGRVTNAQVSGVTGPAGSCVAQAVRKAQFPKFKNKVFKVQYPFKL
jgi:predicted Zn finger-like uncharacterized protein